MKMDFCLRLLLGLFALAVFVPVKGQNAYQIGLPKPDIRVSGSQHSRQIDGFVMDDQLKQEVSFRAGVAFPLGWTRDIGLESGEGGVSHVGAKAGMGAALSYRFYPIPYFFIGGHLDFTLLGYDFTGFSPGNGGAQKIGWNAYALAAVLGARLPLGLYGLYFSPHVGIGYGIMVSPSFKAVNVHPAPTPAQPNRTVRTTTTLLASGITYDLYFTGGMALEYRFRQRWMIKAFFDYNYMPSKHLGSDQEVAGASGNKPKQRLSAMTVGVGINYAF